MKFTKVGVIGAVYLSMLATASARDFLPSDLNTEDCFSKESMKQAEKRLKGKGIQRVSFDKIKDACRFVPNASHGSGISIEQLEKRLATFNAEFSTYIEHGQGVNLCSDRHALLKMASKHGIGMRNAHNICREHEKAVLNGINSQDVTSLDPIALGDELLSILDSLHIERNPYVSGLRTRFVRSHKPGIEPEAPSPQSLVKQDGSPWVCTGNKPFLHKFGTFSSGNNSTGIFPLKFYAYGNRVQDSDGYRYNTVNSLEMTAGDPKGDGFLRNARVEYYCEKINPANCEEDNADLKVLIIEESVRTKGLLYNLFNWIKGLGTNYQDLLMNFMAAKSWGSQGDYISKDAKECRRSGPLFGCEVAINYLECWEDGDAALSALGIGSLFEIESALGHTIR